jgi:hypothetical protein
MARYAFNIRDGEHLEKGAMDSLPDLEAAHQEAVLSAQRIIDHMNPTTFELSRLKFEITDCAGRVVLVVPFAEALSERRQITRRPWWRLRES